MTIMEYQLTPLTFDLIFKNLDEYDAFVNQFNLILSPDDKAISDSIYYLLRNRYAGCAVAYDTVDLFLAEFGIVYTQYFRQYCEKKKTITDIYKLTDDDYAIVAESMTNVSNSPNYNTTEPWQVLEFISNQSRGRTKASKVVAVYNKLRQLPDAQVDYIISKFDYLWLDILPSENIYTY